MSPYRAPPPVAKENAPRPPYLLLSILAAVTWFVVLVAHGSVFILILALALLVPVIARGFIARG